MFRIANIVMVGALLVTAAVVYQLKYASTAEAERLATLRVAIRKERDAIAVMRAEWARRTSPVYIQGLAERHLDLKRLDVDAISALDDLPEKPKGGDDGIGGMIEALVDAPLVTSSTARPATAPTGTAPGAVPATSALRQAKPVTPKPATGPATSAATRPAVRPAPSHNDPNGPLLPPGSVGLY